MKFSSKFSQHKSQNFIYFYFIFSLVQRLTKINRLLIHNNERRIFINYGNISVDSRRLRSTVQQPLSGNYDLYLPAPITQQQTGIDNSLFADATFILESAENTLSYLHEASGFSWLAIIPLAALVMRLSVFIPLNVSQSRQNAKYVNAEAAIKKEVENRINLKNIRNEEERKILIEKYKNIRYKVQSKENITERPNPLTNIKFPAWMGLSVVFSDLCLATNGHISEALQLKTEGFFWLKDLTQPDPYFILPMMFAITTFANMQYGSLKTKEDIFQLKTTYRIIRYPLLFLGVYFSAILPSGVGYFWLSSSALSLAERIAYDSPRIKPLLGIPKTALDQKQPFVLKINLFKDFLKRTRKNFKNTLYMLKN